MTPAEASYMQTVHEMSATLLVWCGDGADHTGHPNTVVAYAVRRFAWATMLALSYGIPSIDEWELHEAVRKMHPFLDPTCVYCRVRFAMFHEETKAEEAARQERIAVLLAP